MNFTETMTLYRAISALTLKCPNEPFKISIIDNQKDGYTLKVKKGIDQKCCNCCCIRNFSKHCNFQVSEDSKYLSIRLP